MIPVTLWTIQHYEAWINMQKTGILKGNSEFVEEDFISSYRWMIEQMEKKLAGKPDNNSFPDRKSVV